MASPLAPGTVLDGRYRVERVLGEGGMGVVVAAQHLVLGERVALKMLLPEAASIPGVVPRFQREAKAASRIQSEHVARVMDVGMMADGAPYLVMEYVEGRDLAAELEARGPLPVEEAVGYVLQAAVGVAEAHALGIVHRDLKPANLFLARLPNGRSLVKVLDFGIAKDISETAEKELTSTFSALGSALYMSPEQVRMAKTVDARTDIWAFGVVLFELLTGQMPFDGESITAIAAAIAMDPPKAMRTFRADIPPGLEAVVARCLEKDRERRTPTLAALAADLTPFGGSYASVLAGRISEALRTADSISGGEPALSPAASAQAPPRPPRAKAADETRPNWATTAGDGAAGASSERRVLVFGVAGGVALLVAAVFAWRMSRGPADDATPNAPASASGPAPSAERIERTLAPPAPAPAAPPGTTTAARPPEAVPAHVAKARRVAPAPPTPPASKAPRGKPLVKDL